MSSREAGNSLQWFWNRLRCMSMPELGYHFAQKCLSYAESFNFLTADKVPTPNLLAQNDKQVDVCADLLSVNSYVVAADHILAGDLDVFALRPIHVGHPPRWNKDPLTCCEAPLQFGPHTSLTNRAVLGDVKYLWEPNRHLHWVTLAQAFALTGEQRFIDGIAVQLESWLDQCPYLQGANWSSSLELALRLINWSIVWSLIGGNNSILFDGNKGRHLLQRWLDAIYRHCHFIKRHLSAYSSANNHRIGELAGLYIAATAWPIWPESKVWQASAKRKLIYEALEQNGADGVNKEQALAYQQFVLDFLLLSGLAGRRFGDEFPMAYWERIEQMLDFLASIMDVAGNLPMWGDADDGFVVRMHTAAEFSPYHSLLATGAVLFQRADFKVKAGRWDEKSLWLLGRKGWLAFDKLSAISVKLPPRLDFEEGGYYIIGTDFETNREIRLLLDCGHTGYLGIAAHGHADALSFVLSIGGYPILIDPGTFSYWADKKWRDYFRGTSAHNTVRIDNQDQSVSGGRFMWVKKAQAKCIYLHRETDGSAKFIGVHDGYSRLSDPVTHERTVVFGARERTIEVSDRLICKSGHEVELFWHFDESCKVLLEENSHVTVRRDGVCVEMRLPEIGGEAVLLKGSEDPIGGWVSQSYDVKVATTTLRWRGLIDGEVVLRTIFKVI